MAGPQTVLTSLPQPRRLRGADAAHGVDACPATALHGVLPHKDCEKSCLFCNWPHALKLTSAVPANPHIFLL